MPLPIKMLNPLPHIIETLFNTFANKADTDLPDQGPLSKIRYDPTLVDLTSNFFVLCSNQKALSTCIYELFIVGGA